MLIFNPLESQYKVPFGAVCERQEIRFSVFCRSLDCTELFLCLHDEDGAPLMRLPMHWECAVEYGCCWSVEYAFEKAGLDMDFYNSRKRGFDEILPWDVIDCGISKKFLQRECEKAYRGETTANCRQSCAGCGLMDRCEVKNG